MKRKTVKMLALLVALTLALGFAGCGTKPQTQPAEDEKTEVLLDDRNYKVETSAWENVWNGNGGIIFQAYIDTVLVTGGTGDAARKITDTYYSEYVARGKEYVMSAVQSDMEAEYIDHAGRYISLAEMGRNDSAALVFHVTEDSFPSGAPRATVFSTSLNFDAATGEKLHLSDLGIDGADPADEIVRLLTEAYMASEYYSDYELGYEDAEATIRIMSTELNQWYLTEGALVLQSNVYDLATYAAGAFEVVLPARCLEGIVDSRWFFRPEQGEAYVMAGMAGTYDEWGFAVDNFFSESGENSDPETQPDGAQESYVFQPYIPDSYYDEELGGAPVPLWDEPVTTVYNEEDAARFADIIGISDAVSEECSLIWWNSDVSDVMIIPVTMLDDGTWAGGVSDYSIDRLNMGTAIALTMLIPEGMPTHAIRACVDGQYRVWAMGYNGRIGGISFVEIELSQAG